MTISERRAQLEKLIKKDKELDVNYIRDFLKVSSVTVRNDLIYLERKGIIERKFGKVVLKDESSKYSIFDPSDIKELAAKEKIGKYAASLIEDNDSIFLYTGSTTLQIARFIPKDKSAITVTNSLSIANELRKNRLLMIIFLGGNLNIETGSTYGMQSIKQLDYYNIDKLFLAVDGVSAQGGITNDQPFETDLNNAIIGKAKKIIIVADHTKIGRDRFVQIQSTDKIHMLITDSKADKGELEKIRALGVEVIVV